MTSFTDILSGMTFGQIEKPKPLPIGSYGALIKGIEFDTLKNEKQSKVIRINTEITSPLSDVDQAALVAYGNVVGKKARIDFFLTDESAWRVQEFVLNHVGADLTGMTFDQGLPTIINHQVGIHITHEADKKDPTQVFANVDKTFKL